MPRLAEIQSVMREAVVAGDESGVLPLLAGGRYPRERLRIHRRHYETSLVTALLGKFPATTWLVGSPFVTEAAQRFVHQHPPQRPCIAEYGEGFPEYLSARPAAERVPYLQEFARLEWHVGNVSIAIDQPVVPVDELSKTPAEALSESVVVLQPGLGYLDGSWPVDELMKLYLTESPPDSFQFEPKDVWIEVRGARGEFRMNRLTRGEFLFRKSIFEGRSIGDAAEMALDADAGFDPGRALAALLADGLITAIKHRVPE